MLPLSVKLQALGAPTVLRQSPDIGAELGGWAVGVATR
jgi:hypothetical protein